MTSQETIQALGGPSEVARLCEVSPQAVSQWFGIDPASGEERTIPRARLMFLKAVRPEVFAAAELPAAPAAEKAEQGA